MATALVVVQPFASYARGDRITDPEMVEKLKDDHAHRVVKIVIPDEQLEHEDNVPENRS